MTVLPYSSRLLELRSERDVHGKENRKKRRAPHMIASS